MSELVKTGANRQNLTPQVLVALLLGSLLTVVLTLATLHIYENGLDLSPKLMLAIAAPPGLLILWWLLRVDWPAPLPRREAAPLDRVALLLMSLAMLTMTLNGVRAGGSMAASDVFLVLAMAAAAPSLFYRQLARPMMLPLWLVVPAFVLVVVGLVAQVFLGDQLVSLVGLLRLVAALLLVPLAVGMIGGTQRSIVWLVDLWIVSAMINAGVAIVDYGLHTGIGFAVTHVVSEGRSTGLTTHSNHLGVAMCMTTPLILARMTIAGTRILRLAFFLALCAAGLAVLATGSRGALVGFALAAALGTFMLPREMIMKTFKWLLIAGLAGLVLAAAAFREDALNSVERVLGTAEDAALSVDESDAERKEARDTGIAQFTSHPLFGAGLANAQDAHLIYLQMAASSGLIGLIAFLSFFAGSIGASRKRARAPDLPLEVRAIVAGAGASVAVWAVLGLVENQIADRYLYVPSGLVVAGIWYSVRNIPSNEQPHRTGTPAGEAANNSL